MKALFIGALSLGLVVGTGAWADDNHHNNNNEHHTGGGNHEQHGSSGGHESHESSGGGMHHSEAVHDGEHHTTEHHATEHRATEHRDVDVHRKVDVHRNVEVRGGARLGHFHRSFRAPHRFHMRAWVGPRGFSYRRFGIGERIPAALLVADFFIADYAAYDLEYPGDAYVWVRDGDDAVLVDRYTGEVIEVEYDVFY